MKNKTKLVISALCILIALGILAWFIAGVESTKNKYTRYKVDYAAQADLKYYACMSNLVDKVDEYIKVQSPNSNLTGYHTVMCCLEENIDLIFVLAQTQLESNFGVEGLASKTNSAWNQGAFDGDSYTEILDIYKYNHPDASLRPYLSLLKRKYLQDKIEFDLMEKFENTEGKRYATDKDYEKKLRSIYDRIKTETELDSLMKQLNYWAIRAGRE